MIFQRKGGGVSWLLVGLGNPGKKYERTRHNVGFMVADEIGERQNAPIQKLKFKALTNLFTISGQKVLVMKPVTFMNLSGEAVRQAVQQEAERIVREGVDPDLWRRIKKGSYGGKVRSLNSFENLCVGQAQSFFAGSDLLDFPRLFDTVEKADVENLIARWVTPGRTALSVVRPGEEEAK